MNLSYKKQFNKQIPWLRVFTMIGLFIIVSFLSMVLGFAAALEMHKVIVVILGGLLGLLLLTLPNAKLLIVLWVISIFIVGQIHYFGGFKQANWIPYLFGLILYFKVYFAYILDPLNKDKVTTPIVFAVLGLLLLVVMSSIMNGVSILQTTLGSRNYLFIWSMFFLIIYSGISLNWLTKVWKGIPFVIAFQIPLVLYQAFIIVPQRVWHEGVHGSTVWDAVVGGFGGNPFGGGASPALAFFLVFGILYFTALYRENLISKKRFIFYLFLTSPSLLLAEIKVIFVLIPLALLFLFLDKIKTKPFKFIFIASLLSVVLMALLSVYEYQKTGSLEKSLNPEHLYEQTFAAQVSLDPSQRNAFGEIGRLAVVTHWWSENGFDEPVKTIFGYGVGATALTPQYVGEVRMQYPYLNMDRSVISILLWELGLLGFLIFSFILLRASFLAFKASKSTIFDCKQRVTLQVTSIMLLLTFLVIILHSTSVFYIPAVNLLVVFLVGYAVYCYRLVVQSVHLRAVK